VLALDYKGFPFSLVASSFSTPYALRSSSRFGALLESSLGPPLSQSKMETLKPTERKQNSLFSDDKEDTQVRAEIVAKTVSTPCLAQCFSINCSGNKGRKKETILALGKECSSLPLLSFNAHYLSVFNYQCKWYKKIWMRWKGEKQSKLVGSIHAHKHKIQIYQTYDRDWKSYPSKTHTALNLTRPTQGFLAHNQSTKAMNALKSRP